MSGLTDRRDVIGGGLVTLAGAGVSIYSALSYDLGTMRLMGAGLFPTVLGVILAVLGVVIAIAGRNVRSKGDDFDLRRFIVILASLAAFLFVASYFGMVPGVAALVIVSTLAVNKLGIVGQVILTLALVAISVAIFNLLFTLQLPLFRWPFQ